MKKRQHCPTSKEAHESVKEHKAQMYTKIRAALIIMRVGGTSAEIADVCNLEHEQVWKRLSESSDFYKTGLTKIGKKNRKCVVWQLMGVEKTQPPHPRTNAESRIQKEYQQASLFYSTQ